MARTKRLTVSKHFPVERKTKKYTISPRSGPHGKERCIPLGLILRDVLHVAETGDEVRRILGKREILVDGKIRQDRAYPVGVMDVISIPKLGKNYRMIPKEGKLTVFEITTERAKFKLCRIEGKSNIRGSIVQLNLHDGRNIRIPLKNPKKPSEDVYHVGDTLKVSLPEQKIDGHYPFEKGSVAVVTEGNHAGLVGKIKDIITTRDMQRTRVMLSDEKQETLTVKDYVFVIGKDKPEILLS